MDVSKVRIFQTKAVYPKKLTWKLCEGAIEANPFAFLDFIRFQYYDLPTGFLNTARIVNLGISTITSSLRAEIGQMYTVMRCIRYSEYLYLYYTVVLLLRMGMTSTFTLVLSKFFQSLTVHLSRPLDVPMPPYMSASSMYQECE